MIDPVATIVVGPQAKTSCDLLTPAHLAQAGYTVTDTIHPQGQDVCGYALQGVADRLVRASTNAGSKYCGPGAEAAVADQHTQNPESSMVLTSFDGFTATRTDHDWSTPEASLGICLHDGTRLVVEIVPTYANGMSGPDPVPTADRTKILDSVMRVLIAVDHLS